MRSSNERSRRAGFTLVELMIVVAILAILAAVSIPTVTSYVYKAKAVEATGFLNEIKARQESYHADTGQYCNVSVTMGNTFPSATPTQGPQRWPDPMPAAATDWVALGAVPPGRESRFVYSTVAGLSGTTPTAAGFPDARGYTGVDDWFISTAVGDLDGDGVRITFESYSHSKAIWTSNASGWE
jgi:type IV pilus assembly protein PilE